MADNAYWYKNSYCKCVCVYVSQCGGLGVGKLSLTGFEGEELPSMLWKSNV